MQTIHTVYRQYADSKRTVFRPFTVSMHYADSMQTVYKQYGRVYASFSCFIWVVVCKVFGRVRASFACFIRVVACRVFGRVRALFLCSYVLLVLCRLDACVLLLLAHYVSFGSASFRCCRNYNH